MNIKIHSTTIGHPFVTLLTISAFTSSLFLIISDISVAKVECDSLSRDYGNSPSMRSKLAINYRAKRRIVRCLQRQISGRKMKLNCYRYIDLLNRIEMFLDRDASQLVASKSKNAMIPEMTTTQWQTGEPFNLNNVVINKSPNDDDDDDANMELNNDSNDAHGHGEITRLTMSDCVRSLSKKGSDIPVEKICKKLISILPDITKNLIRATSDWAKVKKLCDASFRTLVDTIGSTDGFAGPNVDPTCSFIANLSAKRSTGKLWTRDEEESSHDDQILMAADQQQTSPLDQFKSLSTAMPRPAGSSGASDTSGICGRVGAILQLIFIPQLLIEGFKSICRLIEERIWNAIKIG